MRCDPRHPDQKLVHTAARIISAGGVVLHPTDTIHGLACDPFNQKAIERILELKGRSHRKGFLVLIPDRGWVDKFAEGVTELFWRLADEFWPGPVTLIGRARKELPPLLIGEGHTIGLRQPRMPFLEQWLAAIPGPVVSTSASLSGQPLPVSPGELERLFKARVDLFLVEEVVDVKRPPSTVVDLTGSKPSLVRRGQQAPDIARFLGINEEAAAG